MTYLSGQSYKYVVLADKLRKRSHVTWSVFRRALCRDRIMH